MEEFSSISIFYSTENNIDNWITKREAAVRLLPVSKETRYYDGHSLSIDSIREALGIVNSYNQLMGETGARNLDDVDKNNFYNVDITGNEFGRYKDLNELRKKATTWYTANLQGTSVYNPAIGEIRLEKGIGRSDVRFSRKGKSKMAHTSANEKKLLLVPSLKELIEKSNFITEAAPTKDKHKDEYFYYLHCSVGSGNNREYVIVTVVQDQGNNLSYYNHNVLTAAEYKKIEDTYTGAHGTEYSRSGQNPQEVPSFTNSITCKAKVYKQQSVV